MNERLNRFTSLLKQIFELDKSDLDFGIYRVMNLRKAQIEEFLTERLPQMVQETLAPFAQGSKEEIRAKMKQIEDSVSEMGMTVDALPDTAQKKQQYLQLQKQLAEGADLAALETDVYSALYSFFNRYYEDGDFISKRRVFCKILLYFLFYHVFYTKVNQQKISLTTQPEIFLFSHIKLYKINFLFRYDHSASDLFGDFRICNCKDQYDTFYKLLYIIVNTTHDHTSCQYTHDQHTNNNHM